MIGVFCDSLKKIYISKQSVLEVSLFFLKMVSAICLSNKQTSKSLKYGLEEIQLPPLEPKQNETLVQIQAASLNHRY